MKNDHFLGIFSCLGSFNQAFGQVKEWLLLKLREMISMLHAAACLIFPFCFLIEVGRGSVQSY